MKSVIAVLRNSVCQEETTQVSRMHTWLDSMVLFIPACLRLYPHKKVQILPVRAQLNNVSTLMLNMFG